MYTRFASSLCVRTTNVELKQIDFPYFEIGRLYDDRALVRVRTNLMTLTRDRSDVYVMYYPKS